MANKPVSRSVIFYKRMIAAALAIHACIGAKSLLKDLSIDRKYRDPVRVAFAVLAIVSILAVLAVYEMSA